MDKDLHDFIKDYRDTTEYYNFVSQMQPTCGKFRIERLNIESFWTLYCNKLKELKR